MASISFESCSNCEKSYEEVYILPCMHSFCRKCTNLMKNGATTTCLTCSSSCHQDEIRKNVFIEKICSIKSKLVPLESEVFLCELCDPADTVNQTQKYCIDCSQYICSKCSTIHFRSKASNNHKIVYIHDIENFPNTPQEALCVEHGSNLTVYCKTCDVIVCDECFAVKHGYHKSECLEDIFAKSHLEIIDKISKIDNIIKSNFLKKNKLLANSCIKKCDKVRKKVEDYACDLKNLIDKLTRLLVNKINTIKNDYIRLVRTKSKEIKKDINSMTELKASLQELMLSGSSVDIFNKKMFNKVNSIELKKPKLVSNMVLSCQASQEDLNFFISNSLLNSLKSFIQEDLTIYKLESRTFSTCVFKQSIYTVDNVNKRVDVYDIETARHSSIDYSQHFKSTGMSTFIVSTRDALFLYIEYHNVLNIHKTCIFKLNADDGTLIELTNLIYYCGVSSTHNETLLVRTIDSTLVEFSADGAKLKQLRIPAQCIISLPSNFNIDHQLKDGRYLVTSFNNDFVLVSLLDSHGTFVKSFRLRSTADISTCTDGERFVFVLEIDVGKVAVLSTELRYLHAFNYPGVKDIYFDKASGKVVLLRSEEIICFRYEFVEVKL